MQDNSRNGRSAESWDILQSPLGIVVQSKLAPECQQPARQVPFNLQGGARGLI